MIFVKDNLNIGRPLSKPKYIIHIYSEKYRGGKGEKYLPNRSERVMKLNIFSSWVINSVPFA